MRSLLHASPTTATTRRGPRRLERANGFTLLEIIVALTLTAAYLLPLMLVVSQSKQRAVQFNTERQVRDLAQRKLFDVIHYYDDRTEGDFAEEGRPTWRWEVPPPEMIGESEQPLLEYRIIVSVPQKLKNVSGGSAGGTSAGDLAGELIGGSTGRESVRSNDPAVDGSTYEMMVWSFPDERWYEEQWALYQRGQYSPLYGDPRLGY